MSTQHRHHVGQKKKTFGRTINSLVLYEDLLLIFYKWHSRWHIFPVALKVMLTYFISFVFEIFVYIYICMYLFILHPKIVSYWESSYINHKIILLSDYNWHTFITVNFVISVLLKLTTQFCTPVSECLYSVSTLTHWTFTQDKWKKQEMTPSHLTCSRARLRHVDGHGRQRQVGEPPALSLGQRGHPEAPVQLVPLQRLEAGADPALQPARGHAAGRRRVEDEDGEGSGEKHQEPHGHSWILLVTSSRFLFNSAFYWSLFQLNSFQILFICLFCCLFFTEHSWTLCTLFSPEHRCQLLFDFCLFSVHSFTLFKIYLIIFIKYKIIIFFFVPFFFCLHQC